MIIDAKELIVGRFATIAAKKALLGEKVDIINCEHAVITGKKKFLISESKRRYDMGLHTKGPFTSRMPDRYVRRIIRGMIPYKQERGRTAYERVMCYIGVPKDFEGKPILKIEGAHISKIKDLDFMTLGEICKRLGSTYKGFKE
jgi:large subunit ribosomal protein L13